MDTLFARICILVILFSTVGCKNNKKADLPGPDDGSLLSLATYNVGVFDKSGFDTTEMIADMMKELGVQVLSMNELDSCNPRHPAFQLKDFAEAMGNWGFQFGPAIDYKGGKYGVGVAYSPMLEPIRKYAITLEKGDGAEQRALAVCEFKDFVFASTHLDHKSADAQLAQAEILSGWASVNYGKSDKPVFVCGDFNALPDSETITLMRKDWKILSPIAPTFSAKKPSKCIDYIMVYKNASKRVSVISSGVGTEFSSGDVQVASDHLPVYLKIRIR